VRRYIPLVLQANRVRKGEFASNDSQGMMGMFRVLTPGGALLLAVSSGADMANGWEHVAVSGETRTPTWEEACFVKDIFWSEDELVVQFHPPKMDQVVFKPHVLHLWKSLRTPIPAPPTIISGLKTPATP